MKQLTSKWAARLTIFPAKWQANALFSWWWGWFTPTSKRLPILPILKGIDHFGEEVAGFEPSTLLVVNYTNPEGPGEESDFISTDSKLLMSSPKRLPLFCMFFWNGIPKHFGVKICFILVMFHHAALPFGFIFRRCSRVAFANSGSSRCGKSGQNKKPWYVLSSWWFQRLFMFTLIWGDDPIWRSYFSDGWEKTTN